MHISRRSAIPFLALAVACTGLIAPASAAAKLKPKLGIYDCQPIYFTMTRGDSIKFKRKNRYEIAQSRNGKKLVNPTSGTYKLKRGKIVFKRGALHKTKGKLRRSSVPGNPPLLDILYKGTAVDQCVHISAK